MTSEYLCWKSEYKNRKSYCDRNTVKDDCDLIDQVKARIQDGD